MPWLDSGPKAFTWPVAPPADPAAAHRRRASNPEDGPSGDASLIDNTLGPIIVYTNLARHRQCGGLFLKALNKPVHALSWPIQDPASLVPLLTSRLQFVVNRGWSGELFLIPSSISSLYLHVRTEQVLGRRTLFVVSVLPPSLPSPSKPKRLNGVLVRCMLGVVASTSPPFCILVPGLRPTWHHVAGTFVFVFCMVLLDSHGLRLPHDRPFPGPRRHI